MIWKKIKHLIGFDRLLHPLSLDSNLESSNGQNKVVPESSQQPSPSSTSPPDNPPPASHNDETPIRDGSNPTVTDPPKNEPFADKPCEDSPRDLKRVGKMTYSATLGVIAISVTLLMSIPSQIPPDQLNLYACTAAFACLSLITSFGVIYYSIANPIGEKLVWVQEKVMMVYGSLVVLAVLSRMAAMFPLIHFLFMLLAIVAVIGLVILCLYLAWQAEKKIL